MVVQRNKMGTEVKEKVQSGEGNAEFVHLVECEHEKNIRLLSEITLKPGCSVGYHRHDKETEYYLILSGTGTVNDNGTDILVQAGDVMVTGNGESHSIKNTGTTPLLFHAIIVTY